MLSTAEFSLLVWPQHSHFLPKQAKVKGSGEAALTCSLSSRETVTAVLLGFFFLPPSTLIPTNTVIVVWTDTNTSGLTELTPVCVTGGQFDQRGAECRRSAGSSFQRSDYSSDRGASARRGQVCAMYPPRLSSTSICRFLSLTSLCLTTFRCSVDV